MDPNFRRIIGPQKGTTATLSVVLLHGYGQSPRELIDCAKKWVKMNPSLRVVLPKAKALEGQSRWYKVPDPRWDEPSAWANPGSRSGYDGTMASVLALLRAESRIVDRVAVAGFSQGGQIALAAALRSAAEGVPLAGVVALAPAPLIDRELPDRHVCTPFPVFVTWGGGEKWDRESAAETCLQLRCVGVPIYPVCLPKEKRHIVNREMQKVSARWLAALSLSPNGPPVLPPSPSPTHVQTCQAVPAQKRPHSGNTVNNDAKRRK